MIPPASTTAQKFGEIFGAGLSQETQIAHFSAVIAERHASACDADRMTTGRHVVGRLKSGFFHYGGGSAEKNSSRWLADAVLVDSRYVDLVLGSHCQTLENVRNSFGVDGLVGRVFRFRRAVSNVVRNDRLAQRFRHVPAQDGECWVDVADLKCHRWARKHTVALQQAIAQVVHVLDAAEMVVIHSANVAGTELDARRWKSSGFTAGRVVDAVRQAGETVARPWSANHQIGQTHVGSAHRIAKLVDASVFFSLNHDEYLVF